MKCFFNGKCLWACNLMVVLAAMFGAAETVLANRAVSDAAPRVATSQDARAELTALETPNTLAVARTFQAAPAATTTKAAAVPAAQAISFSAVRVSDPSVDAGSGVKIYRNMLYGHSHLAFNVIKTMAVGTVFSATIDSVERQYRVVSRAVYDRAELDNNNALRAMIYNYRGGVSLMTCGDGSNNDRSQRLVLLAERV